MPRFLKPGRLVLYILLGRWIFSMFGGAKTIDVPAEVTIEEGESVSKMYEGLSFGEKYSLRKHFKDNEEEVSRVQPGRYVFSGAMTPEDILEIFVAGPKKSYNHITVLEGWSIYDIDAHLTKKGLIEQGEYREFVTNPVYIERYGDRYEFIGKAREERGNLKSLEGYLMPSTYYVDPEQDTVDQLVYLQLDQYQQSIWEPYKDNLLGLTQELQREGYEFPLSTYGAMILASIIEKEERVPANRNTIASVFFNRLDNGMRIDADISLCYGLKITHTDCTPELIGRKVHDPSNPYNTRAVGGLPPTPIASPTASSITALWDAVPSQNFFYLHDSDGGIHVGKNLSEHNSNKSKYIR